MVKCDATFFRFRGASLLSVARLNDANSRCCTAETSPRRFAVSWGLYNLLPCLPVIIAVCPCHSTTIISFIHLHTGSGSGSGLTTYITPYQNSSPLSLVFSQVHAPLILSTIHSLLLTSTPASSHNLPLVSFASQKSHITQNSEKANDPQLFLVSL